MCISIKNINKTEKEQKSKSKTLDKQSIKKIPFVTIISNVIFIYIK